MSPNVSVEEDWAPEPELRDMPPRRIERTDEPDLNLPSVPFWAGLGGLLMVTGIVLLALAHGKLLFTIPGILLFLTGIGCAILGPYNANRHRQRCEYLVTNGVPKMVRVITSDNLAGSPYKRSVRYQYIDLNGDVKHKDVNIDDRLLPKRIPANMTAVMDMNTGDIELYQALPHRAVAKTITITPVVVPTTATATTPTTLPTMATPTAIPATTASVKTAGAKEAAEKMATMANTTVSETSEMAEEAVTKTPRKRATKKDTDEKKTEEVYE
jgi:hypothetical protein